MRLYPTLFGFVTPVQSLGRSLVGVASVGTKCQPMFQYSISPGLQRPVPLAQMMPLSEASAQSMISRDPFGLATS